MGEAEFGGFNAHNHARNGGENHGGDELNAARQWRRRVRAEKKGAGEKKVRGPHASAARRRARRGLSESANMGRLAGLCARKRELDR